MPKPNLKYLKEFAYGDMVSIGNNKYFWISLIKTVENKQTKQAGYTLNLVHLWTFKQVTFSFLAESNGDIVPMSTPVMVSKVVK